MTQSVWRGSSGSEHHGCDHPKPTSLSHSFLVGPTFPPPLLALLDPVLLPCLSTKQTCFVVQPLAEARNCQQQVLNVAFPL